jgi:hypothetical protein
VRRTEFTSLDAALKRRDRTASADAATLFDEILRSASTTMENIVTSAMHRGLAVGELAVVVEQRLDGQVICGCALRKGLVRILPRYGQPDDRASLAAELEAATEDELLIAVIIHQGEGAVLIGVRKARGQFVPVR